VPHYVVESYTANQGAALDDARRKACLTAEFGNGVHYLRTTFLPGDETVLHFFEAGSLQILRRAAARAELDHQRIVEAVELGASA